MPTIKDVANLAGLSVATVSRAMNGTGYVSEKARDKIHQAINELNYSPMKSHVRCIRKSQN